MGKILRVKWYMERWKKNEVNEGVEMRGTRLCFSFIYFFLCERCRGNLQKLFAPLNGNFSLLLSVLLEEMKVKHARLILLHLLFQNVIQFRGPCVFILLPSNSPWTSRFNFFVLSVIFFTKCHHLSLVNRSYFYLTNELNWRWYVKLVVFLFLFSLCFTWYVGAVM